MFDVRKILIIFVIGILYAIFSYSLVDAIHPGPDYEDYCSRLMKPMPMPPRAEPINCPVIEEPECGAGGSYFYEYDEKGCPKKITCDYCQLEYDAAKEKYSLFMFVIMSLLGLIAIGIGLFLPKKKHHLHEWVATGFMLGGLITLFIGTAIYYADMARIARPIVILAELILVVYLAYKKLKK
jgi:uncharacterized protein (DUF983 family)